MADDTQKAMSYKTAITEAMTEMAKDPAVCFVGYGIKYGKAMGTLANVDPAQLIEMPVAENLMVGFATGLSLRGRKPVVFIERADFLLHALDAIVNHLDKIELMSRREFSPAVIIRVVVGNSQKPLFTGETHTQDFSEPVSLMLNKYDRRWRHHSSSVVSYITKDFTPEATKSCFLNATENLNQLRLSSIVWEYKDRY